MIWFGSGFRQNEETLKKCLEESRLELMRQEEKYDRLRRHAEDTLEKANAEIDSGWLSFHNHLHGGRKR